MAESWERINSAAPTGSADILSARPQAVETEIVISDHLGNLLPRIHADYRRGSTQI
jgi:hypothetical protein